MNTPKIGRREILRIGGTAVAATLAPVSIGACASPEEPEVIGPRFAHGVASGDPTSTSVILWTRVEPADETAIDVDWEIATDYGLTNVVAFGVATTDANRDFTIKIDVDGLSPATTYYYRFSLPDQSSGRGRTRTTPEVLVDQLRFAVVSCASYGDGYFHVYRNIAARGDLDAVIHLGDYIYEYGLREHLPRLMEPPHEIISLEDYRARYSHYRKDADLQALHKQHPIIHVWDDHEIANNGWEGGASQHDPDEGSWEERKAAALQALIEWLPIRETSGEQLIYRVIRYGELLDLIMLDTRFAGRELQVEANDPLIDDENRTLLGEEQEAWLFEQLRSSTAQWRLIGQQVMMGQIPIYNSDQWDGYPAARRRLFSLLRDEEIGNVVVLTGDIHTSWAINLTEDPLDSSTYDPETGEGGVAVEFVCPGVTSVGLEEAFQPAADGFVAGSGHIKYAQVYKRGYIVLDVTSAKVQADFFHVTDVTALDGDEETFDQAWAVLDGDPRLIKEESAATPRRSAPRLA